MTVQSLDLSTVDELTFRRLMSRHAAGVVVVTVAGDPPAGFTATSFTSVSLLYQAGGYGVLHREIA